MKVLHISKFYPPHNGGIEDVCQTVVNVLKDKTEQKIICFNDDCHTVTNVCNGVDIIRVGVQIDIASQPLSRSYHSILRNIINEFRPDVIHFHAPNPYVAAILLRYIPTETRLIVHWHSDIVSQKIIYSVIKRNEYVLLKRANNIIVTSPNYLSYSKPLQKFTDKCVVIQNIIDVNKFNESPSANITTTIDRYDNKPIVLFVGRHVTYKGLEFLIEADAYMKSDCNILIAGKGPLTEILKKKSENSSRIHFLGIVSNDMLNFYYHSAKIFAFPSITKNEAFGVALAEAMYYGVVPVTFTIPGSGVNWVNLNGETGLEVPNKDAKAFANAIDTLLNDDDLRNSMAEKAKERVIRMFSLDCIADKIKRLYGI